MNKNRDNCKIDEGRAVSPNPPLQNGRLGEPSLPCIWQSCNCLNIVKSSARGQVLIIGIMTMLVLIIAIIFLYDLHSIIRVKVKAQNAADAAALTAANWQRHSLNLIGELNLVKACTVLVSDIVPFGDDSPAGLTTSSEILTEMQARISFVGPMIGFGAAQQAAKNNGMNPVSHFTNVVNEHIANLMNDDFYGESVGINQRIPDYLENHDIDLDNDKGYPWRTPYTQMVEAVNIEQGGIAAAPNVDFASLPNVDPSWLLEVGLWRAVAAEYWCYPTLRSLLKTGDFSGKWWQASIVQNSARFPEECEYSPIYIEYSGVGDTPVFDSAKGSLDTMAADRDLTVSDKFDKIDPLDTDNINTPLPYVKWCIYESRWANDLPSSEWTGSGDVSYLRSPLMPEYIYGGALAKMRCYAEPTAMSSNYKAGKLSGNWVSASDASVAPVTCTALAKPLGKLTAGVPPYAASMVLPVFDKTRLIPVAMQDPTGLYDPFDADQYALFLFLKWAADVDDIMNPPADPPCPNAKYLALFQRLGRDSWRSMGWNRNYVTQDIPTRFDPDTNQTGAGWLQMGRTFTYDIITGTPLKAITTNEDSCDEWPGGGTGTRQGPTTLH